MSLFISYSHASSYRDSMVTIFKYLDMRFVNKKKNEKVIWIDRQELEVGNILESKIKEGIDESNYFLIFISNAYLCSDFVRKKELPWIFEKYNYAAADLEKYLIPVVLQDTDWALAADHNEFKYFINGEEGEPLFCCSKLAMLNDKNELIDSRWNITAKEIGNKTKTDYNDQSNPDLPLNKDTSEIQKLINNRFRCDRKIPFEDFKLLLPTINIVKKNNPVIEKAIIFFLASSDQLVNNFIYHIPVQFKEDFEAFKVNSNLLYKKEFLNPVISDRALTVKNNTQVSRSYNLILYEIQRALKDKGITSSDSIIIPVFLWFDQEVIFAMELFEKIKSEMHAEVCQMEEVKKLELKKISYFISVIYNNNIPDPGFIRQLNSLIDGCVNDADIAVIKDFENIKPADLDRWLYLLKDEVKSAEMKKRILSICDNREITMKEFDDYIMSQKYSD
jgi:hypothetical protein